MRNCSRIIACLIGAVAILTTAGLAQAQQAIRIGVLLPVTGPFAKNGIENWEAMQIARDMINERGGINGRKIEYCWATPPAPMQAARLTADHQGRHQDHYRLVRLAALPSARPPSATAYFIERPPAPPRSSPAAALSTRSRRARARKYSQAAVDSIDDLAKRMNKPVGDLRIALLWENRAFGKSVGDGVRAYATKKNIKLVYDEGYDQFATDMTPIVQKLKDVKPDVLIAISFPNDAILFQRKAKELDFNVAAFIGVSAGYSSPDLRDSIGT
jgi:branched-chain amino acid transport system substrate-binding protein